MKSGVILSICGNSYIYETSDLSDIDMELLNEIADSINASGNDENDRLMFEEHASKRNIKIDRISIISVIRIKAE